MLTTLDAFRDGAQWPPPAERYRREKWLDYKKLFQGKHADVYGAAIDVVHPGIIDSKSIVVNLHKRITTHWADMLIGEPPVITAGDENSPANVALAELLERNALTSTVTYEVAIDTSRYGVGVYKIMLEDGAARVEAQQPEFWYPVVTPNDIRRAQAHVIAYTFKSKAGDGREREYLYVEQHTRGQIETRVHPLTGGVIRGEVDGEPFGIATGVVDTGVGDFLIVPVSNLRSTGEVYGHSDYGDLDTLVSEMCLRLAEMSKILSQHSQPSAYGPESALTLNQRTGRYEFKKQGYFVLDPDDATPGYLTYDGKLEANFKMLAELLNTIYLVAETSPAAFGQMQQGLAESGSALKRLLMADVAKTARIRNNFDPALKRVIRIANELERSNGVNAGDLGTVSIDWRDGLPDDPTETSENVEREMASGVRSRYSAVRILHPDWTEAQVLEELDRIAEDMAAMSAVTPAPPSPVLQFDGGSPPDDA